MSNCGEGATVINHYYGCCCNSGSAGDDTRSASQVLTGTGQIRGEETNQNSATGFLAPGGSQTFPPDFPGPGLGEASAQIRMPAGKLSMLRCQVVADTAPASGDITFVVRVNGADTPVAASTPGVAPCDSGTSEITIADDDLVSVRVSNTYAGSTNFVNFTFSLMFEPS